jgi:hypothetical protein
VLDDRICIACHEKAGMDSGPLVNKEQIEADEK